jgi:hypothetical protein
MATVIQLLSGALACLAFVLIARRTCRKHELMVYAVALVVAASIYLGFAAASGAALSWTALAAGGLSVFSLVALLGWRISAWALILGWTAHAAWDLMIDKIMPPGFAPQWYPFVCIGFDLFLAAYLIARLK